MPVQSFSFQKLKENIHRPEMSPLHGGRNGIEFVLMEQIYHGSNVIVKEPKILVQGFYKDFGFGFYCTKIERQARRWALTKKDSHCVNVYRYAETDSLRIQSFEEMSDEWLGFIACCRAGVEHAYDIVEGPMADDTIWNYVEDFLAGKISRAAFWELAKFKQPTHQIAFCTEKALVSLSFDRSYQL